jgi:hypothetical protein
VGLIILNATLSGSVTMAIYVPVALPPAIKLMPFGHMEIDELHARKLKNKVSSMKTEI